MKKTITLTLIMLLIASMTMISAQERGSRANNRGMGPHGDKGPGDPMLMAPWERILDLAEDIKLTEDQLKAIEKTRDSLHELNEKVVDDLADLRDRFHDLMIQTDAALQNDALKLADQMHNLRGRIHQNTIKAAFELKQILTPDQQKQIQDVARNRMKDRREKRRDGARDSIRDGRRGGGKDGGRGRGERRHTRDGSCVDPETD